MSLRRRAAASLVLTTCLGCANTIDTTGSSSGASSSGGCVPGSACDPCGTSTTGQVLGSISGSYGKVVVDATSLYWPTLLEGEEWSPVSKMSINGGSPEVLATSHVPYQLALDADSVYWADFHDGVFRVPKGGGSVDVLVKKGNLPTAVIVDDTDIYWLSSVNPGEKTATISKMPKTGGPSTALVAGQEALLGVMAIDQLNVYWASVGGPVMKVPKDGGSAVLLAASSDGINLAVDESDVYFTVFNADAPDQSTVMRAPNTGGASTVLATGPVFSLAMDATNLYWSEGDETKSVIKRMSKQGGAPVTVVCRPSGTGYITVDAGFLYWEDATEHAMMKVPK